MQYSSKMLLSTLWRKRRGGEGEEEGATTMARLVGVWSARARGTAPAVLPLCRPRSSKGRRIGWRRPASSRRGDTKRCAAASSEYVVVCRRVNGTTLSSEVCKEARRALSSPGGSGRRVALIALPPPPRLHTVQAHLRWPILLSLSLSLALSFFGETRNGRVRLEKGITTTDGVASLLRRGVREKKGEMKSNTELCGSVLPSLSSRGRATR